MVDSSLSYIDLSAADFDHVRVIVGFVLEC